jgi:protein SCO1/2
MKRFFCPVVVFILWALSLNAAPAAFAASRPEYTRTLENYTVPDVTLVNQDGKRVKLQQLVNSGKPVVVDFIYGTCTTICPVLSAGFTNTNFQRKLGPRVSEVQLVSVSIDPENDGPAVMKKYLKNYRAQPGWDFLTGSRTDIDAVMTAFDAYIPNKMSHFPVMFLKAPGSRQWVRISGLIGTTDFIAEYDKVLKQ